MARTRTTKTLAQRIDLNYFKRPTPLKRAKLWLSVLAPALALAWVAWLAAAKDSRAYSSGRLSAAHAVLEEQCDACHARNAGAFSAKAENAACLACHDGPMHHSSRVLAPNCASCHSEHRGRVNLAAVSDAACAQCHGDLKRADGGTRFASRIESFVSGHPEFAALRTSGGLPASDPGTIQLNHAMHLKPIRRGPTGPMVKLECANCHRPSGVNADTTYGDESYRAAAVSYKQADELRAVSGGALMPSKPATGRELMAPVKFANACAACHLLTFDKRFGYGVPHDTPGVVHAFLEQKFAEYIAAHPGELREAREPRRDLAGRPVAAVLRVYTPKEWVAARVSEAEELLWRKTCKQCHTLTAVTPAQPLPVIAAAETTARWMPHAKFDHDGHRGFSCESCHAKALTSTEASDLLLPGIATCQKCHAPGPEHAESRCFECHTYHDWAKRKEVNPRFTLPALRTGK
jgi:hypothetical protein